MACKSSQERELSRVDLTSRLVVLCCNSYLKITPSIPSSDRA